MVQIGLNLDCKEIQPVHPKGNQSWICFGRTDAEAEAPVLWPPDSKYRLIEKDPDAGKDWRQGEKEMTENEMIGWHHRLDGQEFEQALGVGDGQGSLACCSPWGCKEPDTTEPLNWLICLTSPFLFFLFWLHWVFIVACKLSLVAVCWCSCPEACGILLPWPGIKSMSLHWKADS